jgi:hypothetical protein
MEMVVFSGEINIKTAFMVFFAVDRRRETKPGQNNKVANLEAFFPALCRTARWRACSGSKPSKECMTAPG